MTKAQILPIAEAEVSLSDCRWRFAQEHRAGIEEYWQQRTAEQPKLFNGDILLLNDWSCFDGRFHGQCLVTDFKSFLYWREHRRPDRTVIDFFPAAALHSQEGWLLVGRMGRHHSMAGSIYLPCGSLHTDDIYEGKVDLDGNIVREIKEETGLSLYRTELEPPILISDEAGRLVYVRPVKFQRPASEIVKEIESYLAHAIEPELSEIIVVRGPADISEVAMPSYTIAYIERTFAQLSG
jgi:8-oxo-dGTP pyrophosphatase MutT (NUDIX family)